MSLQWVTPIVTLLLLYAQSSSMEICVFHLLSLSVATFPLIVKTFKRLQSLLCFFFLIKIVLFHIYIS